MPAVLPALLCLTSLIQPGGIVEMWHESSLSLRLWLFMLPLVSSWMHSERCAVVSDLTTWNYLPQQHKHDTSTQCSVVKVDRYLKSISQMHLLTDVQDRCGVWCVCVVWFLSGAVHVHFLQTGNVFALHTGSSEEIRATLPGWSIFRHILVICRCETIRSWCRNKRRIVMFSSVSANSAYSVYSPQHEAG